MRLLLFVFLIVFSFKSKAGSASKAAISYGQKALFSYPAPNKIRKNAEKFIFSLLPVEKDKIAIVGGVGLAIASGSISTKNFKNLRFGFMGWNVSPELNINTRNGEMFTLISVNKEF